MGGKPTLAKNLSLDDPLQFIKGVGPKRADLLKKAQRKQKQLISRHLRGYNNCGDE